MKLVLLNLLFMLGFPLSLKATDLDSQASFRQGIILFAKSHYEFLCADLATSQQKKCHELAFEILDQNLKLKPENVTPRELRSIALPYMQSKKFLALVIPSVLGVDDGREEFQIRRTIWNEFQVIVARRGHKTPAGLSVEWKLTDLRLLLESYRLLKTAISAEVGSSQVSRYSHIWGAGGIIAMAGRATVAGQFGEVWNEMSSLIHVVVSPTASGFGAAEVAQRLAHENAHSQDHLLGKVLTGKNMSWSETDNAKIFSQCQLPAKYEASLQQCRSQHPEWFNFHPTSYSAHNSAEFYCKMLDEWVRENLGLVPKGRYSQQSATTAEFWAEMKTNFLGL